MDNNLNGRSACAKVFGTYELLGMILLQVPSRQTLRLQHVCRDFFGCIRENPKSKVAQALHFAKKPAPKGSLTYTLPPVTSKIFDGVIIDSDLIDKTVLLVITPSATREKPGSWQSMYLFQPPLISKEVIGPRDDEDSDFFLCEQGITMGLVMDTAKLALEGFDDTRDLMFLLAKINVWDRAEKAELVE